VSLFLATVKLSPAGVLAAAVTAACVERKRSLSTSQVGHAHPGQLHAVELFRRECDRYADYAAEYTVLTEGCPKGFALAEQANVGFAQGKLIFAQTDFPAGTPDINRTEPGQIATLLA